MLFYSNFLSVEDQFLKQIGTIRKCLLFDKKVENRVEFILKVDSQMKFFDLRSIHSIK